MEGRSKVEIKKKYMSKKDWNRVVDREYIYQKIEEENVRGVVSLLHIKKVTSPSYKVYRDNITVKIADDNFYWLQIAIEKTNYWITVMYDDKKNIIQYYIDITKENIIKDNEDSYFYDLFLDIVLLNDDVILLDEAEIRQALENKHINIEQYELAYNVTKEIMKSLEEKKYLLEEFSNKYFNILLNKIEKAGV